MNSCCSELPVVAFGMNNPVTAHIRLPTNTYNWLLLDGPILIVTEGLSLSLSLSAQMPDDKLHLLLPLLLQQAFLPAVLLAFWMFSQSFLWAHTCKATSQVHHYLTPTTLVQHGSISSAMCLIYSWCSSAGKHNMKHMELTRKHHPCMNRHTSTSREAATLETTLPKHRRLSILWFLIPRPPVI